MRNVTEIQQRLIALGYPVGPHGADGRFGHDTLDAYNRFRASKGKGPVVQASMAELNADLFPEEQPPPPPLRKPGLFDVLALIIALKGKTMKWSTVEQLIRIALYTGGGIFFGQQVADGQMFQAALGGLLSIGAFVWWLVFESNRPKA